MRNQIVILKGLIFLLVILVGSVYVNGQQIEIEWDGSVQELIRIIQDTETKFAIEGFNKGVTFKIEGVDALTLFEGGYVRIEKDPEVPRDAATKAYVDELATRLYEVGDLAHGGIVFWVDETGEHGLVSSQSDLESTPGDSTHQWSAASTVTGATGGTVANGSFDGKGAGAMNTMLIVSADRTDTDSAARLCAGLVEGGYGDWYFPSKGELHLMYTNLQLAGLGGFASNFYWSSTEGGAGNAEVQNFSDGGQFNGGKNGSGRVRAVRAF